MKVMIVGSGGGRWDCKAEVVFCEDIEPGEASFLCVSKRVVRACWSSETRLKGVVCGRWRWARRILRN